MNELDLFAAAIAIVDPTEQDSFLDRECVGRPELRRRLSELICAHRQSHPMLDRPGEVPAKPDQLLLTPTVDYPSRDLQPGAVIADKYKLLERIGEGGMGEVWVADQLEPIKRRIAVKLIKPGMDSRSVLARFEAERQALALMDHPNIAKVLDAGTTADGRPYFVMELVKGTPITEFCDARKLPARERLELFVPVCQAIQHAHTKGIIHRDIKPSNVLVALHDERPVPKVIDFGVAKAVAQQLTEKTIYTGFGGLVGTPTYMAPEQATFNQLDIDTRADVYALGVLLYELLAGSPPVEAARMKKAALDEVLRLVREEEPPRPSQRLSTSQSKASIAAVRQTDPEKLTRLIRGELDWIVMKALEKDRTRRYETANGFAADVQRYLGGEPVQAVPASTAYRLNKFVKRHKARVIGAAAFLLLLVTSVIVSSWLAVLAKRAEGVADERRREAETNADRASAEAIATAQAKFELMEEKVKSDEMAESLQVDLDLIESRTDARVGLLQLARPRTQGLTHSFEHKLSNGDFRAVIQGPNVVALREFVTAAVLAAGQNYAPLLPPITHDGQPVVRLEISPDSKTLLTFGTDATARLWDLPTAKPIAILQQGNERVVNGGFSSDGRTIFTDDETGVARFWEPADGKFRARIEARLNIYSNAVDPPDNDPVLNNWSVKRIGRADCMIIGRDRLLTRFVVGKQRRDKPKIVDQFFAGPVELWDTKRGRLIARLDRPDCDVEQFRFLRDGQWITTIASKSTAVVFSTDDGREIARLSHPAEEVVEYLDCSPNGRRVATFSRNKSDQSAFLRMWDTGTWRADPVKMPLPNSSPQRFELWDNDLFGQEGPFGLDGQILVYRFGQAESLAMSAGWSSLDPQKGDRVFDDAGHVFDIGTWQRLRPPMGQKFHSDLTRFAPDGRFVYSRINSTLIDTRTQKQFDVPFRVFHSEIGHAGMGSLKGLGLVKAEIGHSGAEILLIPTAHLDLPADAMELWAQVAVRGELGPEGEFVKWDEPTWEKHRRKLAAIPQPYPDFPFPGYLATDGLHWLRAEYFAATNEAEKQRMAKELLRRAEASGDRIEAGRWRAEQERLSRVPGDKK